MTSERVRAHAGAGRLPDPGVFTRFVADAGEGGSPPDRESFDRVWEALRRDLLGELRRRALWTSPPRFVGIAGADEWDDDAVDELVADAYAFNFVHRLRSLRAQLRVKPNIEGLVRLNLKHFLHERQCKHDPIGYRAFRTLHDAVEGAVGAGTLRVLGGSPAIDNLTELGCGPLRRGDRPTAAQPELTEAADRWAHEHGDAVVTARGKKRDALAATLADRLRELADAGVARFRFKELADPFKDAVRDRWHALHADREAEAAGATGEETALDERLATLRDSERPDRRVEERDAARELARCVRRLIDERGAAADERTADYLRALWRYLQLHAAGFDELPSQRKLAEELGIPRGRFPDLLETLGFLVHRCRERHGTRTAGGAAP